MWARKRIDIGWRDLQAAAAWSFAPTSQSTAQSLVEKEWSPKQDVLVCLSVRSGFDLLLGQLDLPKGSEILMSEVLIQDMARIIEHHGLIPVPVDLDPVTMSPDPEKLEKAIRPETKAILIAHLFGGIIDLSPYAEIAERHNLLLIEDCAQAFDGDRYKGHPQSDVVMFSFGPIKTATALGGGLLTVRNHDLLQRMCDQQSEYPLQKRGSFLKRALVYSALKFIGGYYAFGALVKVCQLLGKDYESLLNGAVRNFPADQFFDALRQQPSVPLCLLMWRRITRFSLIRQDRRAESGILLHQQLSKTFRCPGGELARHTYWVFPIEFPADSGIVQMLRENGFDAATASQLQAIDAPSHLPEQDPKLARETLSNIAYLPLYPEIPDSELLRMVNVISHQE